TPADTANYIIAGKSVTINVAAAATVTSLALAANRPAPQAPGTSITFTGAAAGGTAPYQYEWWVFDGTTWAVGQQWSASTTFTWTPSVVNSAYNIQVWARSAGNSANAAEKSAGVIYAIQPIATISKVTMAANLPSPQRPGTPVTFTAAASGGAAPYQYKWWLFDGTSWTAVQAWSTAATFTWTPTLANA